MNNLEFNILTNLDGPWQVASTQSCRTWYVLNTRTNQFKRIGPTRLNGISYFDRALEEAAKLNKPTAMKQLILSLEP